MNTINPFTPMSFLMLDVTLQEAEELLGNSKLLTPEQKKSILEDYKLLLAEEETVPVYQVPSVGKNSAKVRINS